MVAVGLGTGIFAPPNSKTAGRIGACDVPVAICISAFAFGFGNVNPSFFSAGLNVVSSWSIIGAGSAGFACAAGVGTGIATGRGGIDEAGIFDQPMSERVMGFWEGVGAAVFTA